MPRSYRMETPRSNAGKMTRAEVEDYRMKLTWLQAQAQAHKLPTGWQTLVAEDYGCSVGLVSQIYTERHVNKDVLDHAYVLMCGMVGEKPALDLGMNVENLERTLADLDSLLERQEAQLASAEADLEENLRIVRAQHQFGVAKLQTQYSKTQKRRHEVAGLLEHTQMAYDQEYSDTKPIYVAPIDPLEEIRRHGLQPRP